MLASCVRNRGLVPAAVEGGGLSTAHRVWTLGMRCKMLRVEHGGTQEYLVAMCGGILGIL